MGQLKIQASGQNEMLIFVQTRVPPEIQLPESYNDVEKMVRNLDGDTVTALSNAGALLYCLHVPWSVLYLPPGVIVCEKIRNGINLFCSFLVSRAI